MTLNAIELTVDDSNLDRVIIEQVTETEINPVIDIFYLDAADDGPLPIRDRVTAIRFAHELVKRWNAGR